MACLAIASLPGFRVMFMSVREMSEGKGPKHRRPLLSDSCINAKDWVISDLPHVLGCRCGETARHAEAAQ